MRTNNSLTKKVTYLLIWVFILWLPLAETLTAAAHLKPFTIGLSLQPHSLDPYAAESLSANYNILDHTLETLYRPAQDGAIERVLVESEELEAPNSWLFTLKPNVYFHNGKRLTSEDVIATFEHLRQLPENNPLHPLHKELLQLETVNDRQFRMITSKPKLDLLFSIREVYISPKGIQYDDKQLLANPQLLIGTGPYRLMTHDKLKTFYLEVFPKYHGSQPYLQQVNLRIITDYATRLQAFLDNDIQLMDDVLPEDMDTILAKRPANFSMPSGTKIYHIALDQYREQSPDITDHQGKPLPKNPLKDHRVRAAISQAIDRQALADQFFSGEGATPSGQLVPEGFKGHMPALTADAYAPDKARLLLNAAGYPQGFRLILHDKHARRPILEAIAGMLSEIGIATTVKTLPPSEYFPNLLKHHYSAGLSFYDSYGTILTMLENLITNIGSANPGRYHNPDFDQQLAQVKQASSAEARHRDYGYLVEIAMQDYAIIPLYFINTIWASSPNMSFNPTVNSLALAQRVMPSGD